MGPVECQLIFVQIPTFRAERERLALCLSSSVFLETNAEEGRESEID
jgi:hypothetical protein